MKYRFFLLLLSIMVSSTWLFAEANYVRGTEIKGNELKITFKFPIKKVKHFMIAHKGFTKHIYDVAGGVLPPNTNLPFKHKNVKSFRIGQYDKNTLRIVIETRNQKGKNYYISSKVLIIPLPLNKKIKKEPLLKKSKSKKVKSKKVTVRKRRKSIVIDAGHGGRDNGASAKGVYEKKITLKIAYKLKRELEKRGYKVYMTRKRDRYISLLKRTQFANRKNPNLFVSIHVNAAPKKKWKILKGLETFSLSKRNVHRHSNRIIHKGKVVYNKRLCHVVTSPKKRAYSKYLAKKVERQVSRKIRSKYGAIKSKVKCSDFWVLTGTKMPSILVETGYVTNNVDRRRLTNSYYQNLIAKGIADGINSYFYGHK